MKVSSPGARGEFVLGKTVGEGTFGKVKVGTHVLTGERVAIKILEKNRIKQEADKTRVAREIKILKRIRHPDVIQLYQVVDTPKQIFLIMEYLNGGELFDYIVAHKRLSEKEACKFFHHMIDGVEYLHSVNVVHRDLKPENMLMTRSDDGLAVKIIDFGLGNVYDDSKWLRTACGSPCYAPPEMISGKRYLGDKSDVWSLGVVLFAMLCGYLPFEDTNTAKLYHKILNCLYKQPKWLSHQSRDMLKHLLEVNPARRYDFSMIRKHPWYNQIKREPTSSDLAQAEKPLDEEALGEVKTLGVDSEYLMDSLARNTHNAATAAYFLQAAKNRRLRGSPQRTVSSSPKHIGRYEASKAKSPARRTTVPKPRVHHADFIAQLQTAAKRERIAMEERRNRISVQKHSPRRPITTGSPFEYTAHRVKGTVVNAAIPPLKTSAQRQRVGDRQRMAGVRTSVRSARDPPKKSHFHPPNARPKVVSQKPMSARAAVPHAPTAPKSMQGRKSYRTARQQQKDKHRPVPAVEALSPKEIESLVSRGLRDPPSIPPPIQLNDFSRQMRLMDGEESAGETADTAESEESDSAAVLVEPATTDEASEAAPFLEVVEPPIRRPTPPETAKDAVVAPRPASHRVVVATDPALPETTDDDETESSGTAEGANVQLFVPSPKVPIQPDLSKRAKGKKQQRTKVAVVEESSAVSDKSVKALLTESIRALTRVGVPFTLAPNNKLRCTQGRTKFAIFVRPSTSGGSTVSIKRNAGKSRKKNGWRFQQLCGRLLANMRL